MTNSKLSERTELKVGVINADIADADRTGAYYDVSGARKIRAKLFTSTVAATKVATVQLLQAQDSDGTGSKALSDVISLTAPEGGSVLAPEVEADVDALDADGGFTHVAVKVTSDGTSIVGCASLELGDLRFNN